MKKPEFKYEEYPCPVCEGGRLEFGATPYYKNAKRDIGYVNCKWCMDSKVQRRQVK